MPNNRALLTDKEERILVQAQLMGLSTSSMVKIGNRLRALEREREELANIDRDVSGYTWNMTNAPKVIVITTSDGYEVTASATGKHKTTWLKHSTEYRITVSKPGTRFKTVSTTSDLNISNEWKKKHMPGNNKQLYSLIRWTNIYLPRIIKSK
jgi:hypothetical protein